MTYDAKKMAQMEVNSLERNTKSVTAEVCPSGNTNLKFCHSSYFFVFYVYTTCCFNEFCIRMCLITFENEETDARKFTCMSLCIRVA